MKRTALEIPLVFLVTFDPVEIGLVSNLARPGGNITGARAIIAGSKVSHVPN